MFSCVEVEAAASRSPEKPYGNYATFFPINKEWGYKYYESESYAKCCRDAQAKAYEAGLAPAVGDLIHTSLGYGYITQIATPLANFHSTILDDETTDLIYKMEAELMQMFGREHHFDMSPKNAGRLPCGKIVCIDFSSAIGSDWSNEEDGWF